MIESDNSYPFIQPRLCEPRLCEARSEPSEHIILKKLLKNSYNEGDRPFTQIIGKYTVSVIKENWFYILIIVFILIIIFLRMTKKEPKQTEKNKKPTTVI